MKIFKRLSVAATLAGMILAVSSCGSKTELAELIPADASIVAKIDAKSIVENAGGKIENGKIELPKAITDEMTPRELDEITEGLQYCEGIDFEHVYVAYYKDKAFVVAPIDDKAKVEANLKEVFGNTIKDAGFDCYQEKDLNLIIDGDHLWMLPTGDTQPDDLADMLEAAKEENITKVVPLASFLASDNSIDVAVNFDACKIKIDSDYKGAWAVANIDFDDSDVTSEFTIVNAEGNNIPFGEAFGVMSTDFLRYIPSGSQFVMALGPIESPTLRTLLGIVASEMPQGRELVTDLDGTVAMAMEIPTDMDYSQLVNGNVEELLANSKFIMMAHYPQSVINQILDWMQAMMSVGDSTCRKYGNSGYSFTTDVFNNQPMDFYIDDADGYLALSNAPVKADSQNSFASKFEGKRAAMVAKSEPNAFMKKYGVDYSSEVAIWLESDCVKGEIKIKGTDKKFLEAMIEYYLNPEVRKTLATAFAQADFNDYDF